MLPTVQIIAATLMAFIALLFTIARATPDETAKVFGWGRRTAYIGLLLLVIGNSIYSIFAFVTGDSPPSRSDIAGFALSTLVGIWYVNFLVTYIGDMLSASRRAKISALQKERDDWKFKALKFEVEEAVLKEVHAFLSARLNLPATQIEASEDEMNAPSPPRRKP